MLTPEYPPNAGGIGHVAQALASRFDEEGISIRVLSRHSPELRTTLGTSLAPALFGLLPFWQGVADYIARHGTEYDVVWLHAPVILNPRGLSHARKVLVTIHTTYYGKYRYWKAHGFASLVPYLFLASKAERVFFDELSAQKNATITAVSPSVADEARANGLNLPIYVVHNGMETGDSSQPPRVGAREDLGLRCRVEFSKESKIIVYAGRLTATKQVGLLLRLFAEVNRKRPETHLVVIGSGSVLSTIKKTADVIPNAHVLGYVPHSELLPYLRGSDFFASLSCYEGLPLSALEASSQGLPLILSDIPAHRYLLSSMLGSGILISSRRPSTTDVVDFIDRPKRLTGGSPPLSTEFSWESVVRRYLSLMFS